jgi:hypothetical protein
MEWAIFERQYSPQALDLIVTDKFSANENYMIDVIGNYAWPQKETFSTHYASQAGHFPNIYINQYVHYYGSQYQTISQC